MTIEEYKEKLAKLEADMLSGVISPKQGASEKRKLSTYNSEVVKAIKKAEKQARADNVPEQDKIMEQSMLDALSALMKLQKKIVNRTYKGKSTQKLKHEREAILVELTTAYQTIKE